LSCWNNRKKLTVNQWKLIFTANVADLLDFFDFFLIGYVAAALTKQWSLTYLEGGAILLASGIGAPPGAFFWGWLGDRVRATNGVHSGRDHDLAGHRRDGVHAGTGRRRSGLAVPGVLPHPRRRRQCGIYTIDLPLVQEFIPAYKRGWVSALVTTMLPAGGMLAGLAAWLLLPIVGWRGLFVVGLVPLVLVFMIRYWVPESPRWLMRMGRMEDARKSLAWALMIDPKEDRLARRFPRSTRRGGSKLFKYPRLVASGCLTGLTQTGGASLALWGPTLLVLVLKTSPEHAAFLTIFSTLAAVVGRFFITALIEPLGRRGSATLCMVFGGTLMVSAGYMWDVYIGTWSLFYTLFIAQAFFGSAKLHGRRPLHGRDLAGPVARQRHGPQLRRRQLRQVPWAARVGADHGCRRCDQAGRPNLSCSAGLRLFRLVVCARLDRLLGLRLRTQGPHLRRDRQRA